jgi:hypothetical protein
MAGLRMILALIGKKDAWGCLLDPPRTAGKTG